MQVTSIGNPICRLAECPIWNDAEKALYWTDIPAGRLWRYVPQSNVIETVWEGDLIIGGFAFTANNDIVLCTHKGLYKLTRPTGRLSQLVEIPMAPDERFNDVTTDPQGRIFAGTLTERRKDGILYKLQRNQEPKAVMRDIGTSNGMTFSLDLKSFYHTDSRVRTITRYDYDPDTGDIENPQVIYRGRLEDGSPDGITLDAEGFLWVACYRGGKVLRLNDQGRIIQTLPVPAAQTSSVTFGGDNLDELFITTASIGASDFDRGLNEEGRYLGGHIFRIQTQTSGRTEWRADW